MLRQFRFFAFTIASFFCFEIFASQQVSLTVDEVISNKVDSLIHTLTLEEKVGQLFFMDVSTETLGRQADRFVDDVALYKPGGILFLKGSPAVQLALMERLNTNSKIPVFYAIDGEWGASMRMDSVIWFPKHMMLGAIRDSRVVMEVGEAIGKQCAQLGIDINFAPVLDVNNNSLNPVINMRSFGENPHKVAEKGYAYFRGMQRAGILAVGKHYPGHGDTNIDSHHDLPVINKTLDELEKNEFFPFKHAIQLGLGGIMTGHLLVNALDSTGLPVSLSQTAINYLKNEHAFKGLIFSDALNMRAVYQRFDKHYLKAFMAGNDVLLFPADIKKGISEIVQGVKDGVVSEIDIDNRVRRVLSYKFKAVPKRSVPSFNQQKDYEAYRSILKKAIGHAVTVVKNDDGQIPLPVSTQKNGMLISIGSHFRTFAGMLNRYRGFDVYEVDVTNPVSINKALFHAPEYDDIVVAFEGNIFSVSTNYGFNDKVQNFLMKLPVRKNVTLALFTNPYVLNGIDNTLLKRFQSVLVAYESKTEIENVTAQIIMGGMPAMGALPVSAGEFFPEGTGLFVPKTRLGYGFPEDEGILPDTLALIDSIVANAINDKATPGCQVLIAKNGNVIYDKSFGFHTYKKEKAVEWDDIYDLASVSKIVATVPVVMHLNERKELSLESKLNEFYGLVSDTFKNDISINELLLHQSGLKPFIPFHYNVFDTENLKDGLFSRRRNATFNIKVGDGIYANSRAKFKPGFVSGSKTKKHDIEVSPGFYIFNEITDSIAVWIDSSDVDSLRNYRYSDLNFYYLKKVLERKTTNTIDVLADSLFYAPLGMNFTFFRPLQKYDAKKIVPTEDDRFFRRKLLRGYVHDQAAALSGGVAGHAGVFSNANDLAKFGQMLLNNGFYGKDNFFDWSTVDFFTQTGNQLNRRGLGFDKPEPDTTKISPACKSASLSSFGHSGFTGTYLWIDPELELVYVFLSNRVHPDAYNRKLIDDNVRTNIQQKIYNAVIK